jgi:XTP/dITP diphosphohydrolase
MMNQETLTAFERLSDILDTLRRECPWDRVQTLDSLRYLTIEEVYELSEAILTRDQAMPGEEKDDLKKELGDLFMHLMFYAKIAEDEGRFTLADVLDGISDKLVSRHPFIYHKEEYHGENWEQLKMHEGRRSVLEGVPASLPPLVKALRMQQKASGIGYQRPEQDLSPREGMTEEAFGDLLFGLVHWANRNGINADDALAKANIRFAGEVKDFEEKKASTE